MKTTACDTQIGPDKCTYEKMKHGDVLFTCQWVKIMEAYKMPFINFSVGIIVSSGFCLYKKPHNKDGLDIQGKLMSQQIQQ